MADLANEFRFEIFRDWRGDFRWRLLSGLGNLVATSDTSYRSEQLAAGAVQEMQEGLLVAPVVAEGSTDA
jgi:uncharacterized protein YegP (UPF0339 family)